MIARLRAWWWRRRMWRALDEWQNPGAVERLKLDVERWRKVRAQGARAARP